MPIKTFLDMDGVLVDFIGGCCKLFDKPYPYNTPKNYGVWEIESIWGLDQIQFFKTIRDAGEDFWADLEPTKEARAIVDLIKGHLDPFWRNTAVLTVTTKDKACVNGKYRWLEKNFPELKDRIIIGNNFQTKRFISGPGRLLIDDRTENVNEWEKEKGFGILLPRHWNVNWEQAEDPMRQLRREFMQFEYLYS